MSDKAPVPTKRRAGRRERGESPSASRPEAIQEGEGEPTAAPPRDRGGRTHNPGFAPAHLLYAVATIMRLVGLFAAQAALRDPKAGDTAPAARLADLTPSFRAAIAGELKVLRAQLNRSGLFLEIKNVDLGGDGA